MLMRVRAFCSRFALAIFLLAAGLVACGAVDNSTLAPPATPVAVSQERSEPAATLAPTADDQSAAENRENGSMSVGFFQNAPLANRPLTAPLAQNRVIVRTVDMGVIVADVAQSSDAIVELTIEFGGWMVSSDRSRKHQASLSVRVPAESLDEFVLMLRRMVDKVEYETSASQDVTDDFVDNQARLNGLRSTEQRLLDFLEQAVNVEEALNIQVELAKIRLEIETIEGKLRFLSETAAYSLVNLSLTTRPGDMAVDAGPDATFRAGLSNTFRASFQPPDGVDEFKFTWDFGDGSPKVEGTRTAPTADPGERVTATVTHTYTNVAQSPYIVQLNLSGIGDAGLFLGSDTLIATVSEIPFIEVFAGENRVVDEGDEVEYSGSFTRPESLWDFKYRWDFGDGSATVFDAPPEGETRAMARHVFRDYRPNPYPVVLTVTAQSEAGEVSASAKFNVSVVEVESFAIAGWNIGGTAKSAVRALSVLGQFLLTILIWLGIFSPVWLAALAAVILIPRLRRRLDWQGSGGRLDRMLPSRTRTGAPRSGSPRATFLADTTPDRADTTPDRQDASTPPEGAEPPALTCAQCGREFPAINANGEPSGYCPYCGSSALARGVSEPPPEA